MQSLDLHQYRSEGFTIVEGAFSPDECDALVDAMMALHSGRRRLEGFSRRRPDDWSRTHNQHHYDEIAAAWLADERLRQPLNDCLGGEADGIQTMYFWRGSEQRRHQDQYYLPGCMSAWIALQDVGEENGTIQLQPGSHNGRLLTRADFAEDGEFAGRDYNDAVDGLFASNALPEAAVSAGKGDVVFFHGVLVHRGGPIRKTGSFRHALANHYIRSDLTDWPLPWPRHRFDGTVR